MTHSFMIFIMSALSFLISSQVVASAPPLQDFNQLYSQLLEDHAQQTHLDGLPLTSVDYSSLRKDDRWPVLIEKLATMPPTAVNTPDRQKAFYLNAYNILAINKVLAHWPLRSLRSVGSFVDPVWVHDAGQVAREPVTLEYLEHKVLRGMGDPRVHMAINCASISCPDLRREAYVADRIDTQLDEQAQHFLHQKDKGLTLDEETRTVHLSVVFDWFEEDFDALGGVASFIRTYRPDLPQGWEIVADLNYNWGINSELNARLLRKMRDDF